jgi:hypothetical protein
MYYASMIAVMVCLLIRWMPIPESVAALVCLAALVLGEPFAATPFDPTLPRLLLGLPTIAFVTGCCSSGAPSAGC